LEIEFRKKIESKVDSEHTKLKRKKEKENRDAICWI
jgi:hypothetical protein